MAHAADTTGLRRGLAEIGEYPGSLNVSDGGAHGEAHAGGTADSSAGSAIGADPAYSPPLSSEEIADIDAVASGAEKLYCVSKSRFVRTIMGDTKPNADAQ